MKAKTFIFSGQSNMRGSGGPADLPPGLAAQDIHFHCDGKWGPLGPAADRFGPEITFGAELRKALPGVELAFIKYAIGGSSLYAFDPDWTAAKARLAEDESKGSLYKNLMNQVRAALDTRPCEIAGMLWMQGCSDSKYPEPGKNYAANFRKFILRVRGDLGLPGLPFIYGRINPEPADVFRYAPLVRKAQEDLDLPRTTMVSADGLDKRPDRLHYSSKGLLELGRRFARAVLENYDLER